MTNAPFEKPQGLTIEVFKELMREVYKSQGYIVIGSPLDSVTHFCIGEMTQVLFEFDMGHNFIVNKETTITAWIEQNKLIGRLRPTWKKLPGAKKGRFFEVVPVGKEITEQ